MWIVLNFLSLSSTGQTHKEEFIFKLAAELNRQYRQEVNPQSCTNVVFTFLPSPCF